MGKMTVKLNVYGDYLTDTARSWFFEEHKPYEKVEELLLGCLICDALTLDERKKLARQILLGEKKITGCTGDDSYTVVDDSEFDGLQEISKLFKEIDMVKKDCESLKQRLLDKLDEYGLEYEEAIEEKKHYERESLLGSYMKANKYADNYGWLSPDGIFTIVDWGKHHEWAYDYIMRNSLKDNYDAWGAENFDTAPSMEGDYMTSVLGFVLLHSPAKGVAVATRSPLKRLTKGQKDFLYGYYMDRDEPALAKLYMED